MLHVFYLKSYGSKIGTTKGRLVDTHLYPNCVFFEPSAFFYKSIHIQVQTQDWAVYEGGKLLELARHTVNITYRTVAARTGL